MHTVGSYLHTRPKRTCEYFWLLSAIREPAAERESVAAPIMESVTTVYPKPPAEDAEQQPPVEDAERQARRKVIEEQVRIARERQAANAGSGLTRKDIARKLGGVPAFVVLNGDKNVVSVRQEDGGETIFWHLESTSAVDHLKVVMEQSPNVPGLHVGAMSLAVALPLVLDWDGLVGQTHAGDAGRAEGVKPPSVLRHVFVSRPVAGIELPVFMCEVLQTPLALPVFFDRRDVAAAWVKSGREPAACTNQNLMVIDLRKLVTDMQTDTYSLWSTVVFVPSGGAMAILEAQQAKNAAAVADGDEPPPLE